MAALNIANDVVAMLAGNGRNQLITPNSVSTAKDANLGAQLREQRWLLQLTIATVAAAVGVSAAQLLRIERGQSRRSHYRMVYPLSDLWGEDRARIFTNLVLDDLVAGIWPSDHAVLSGKRAETRQSTDRLLVKLNLFQQFTFGEKWNGRFRTSIED